jgi:iron complex transport system substrate-binding protein
MGKTKGSIMRRNFAGLFAAAVLVCAGASALHAAGTAPASLSAVDTTGRVVILAAPAARIVSLSPAATEVIFAVGAGAALVGDTTYCDYPAEAARAAKVGGFAAPTISVERIVSLRPDLVITAGSMHKTIEAALARFSIPVFSYDPVDFQGIAKGMTAIGDLAGTGAAARKAASDMLAVIDRVRAAVGSVSPEKRPTVFWEIYDDPLMTCGASTFPHAIVEAAGGRDIFSDLPGAWPRVSAEEVIRRAPDYVMGADDHGDKLTAAQVQTRPGWAGVPAVRNGRIALFPADLVSRAGPRVADGVLAVAKVLYPALFR